MPVTEIIRVVWRLSSNTTGIGWLHVLDGRAPAIIMPIESQGRDGSIEYAPHSQSGMFFMTDVRQDGARIVESAYWAGQPPPLAVGAGTVLSPILPPK